MHDIYKYSCTCMQHVDVHRAVPVLPQFELQPINQYRQIDDTSCGYWVLHYIEEEARAVIGEIRCTIRVDLKHRMERLNNFVKTLQQKEEIVCRSLPKAVEH